MNIVVSYDQPLNSLPNGFTATVAAVVALYQSQFSDNITFNLHVGYGEVDGSPLDAGALGESEFFFNKYSYSQIRSALIGDAKSADDSTGLGNVPASDPIAGLHQFAVPQVEAKALGLLSNSTGIDEYIGLSSTAPFDYDHSNGVATGQYDFYGTIAHELAEVMGKNLFAGEKIGGVPTYAASDLFHYSSPGVRDLSGTTPGYFSIDGGATNLDNFNTNPNGDFGDWASSAGHDSWLAFSSPGVVNAVSETDLRFLDVIGFGRGAVDHGAVVAKDFWDEGISDLLWRNTSTGEIDIWRMNTAGQYVGDTVVGAVSSAWQSPGTGDFNGDGTADILFRNTTTGEVDTWQIGSGHYIGGSAVGIVSAAWELVGTGDINADQTADLIWRNTNTGEVDSWLMGTGHYVGGAAIGVVSSAWQPSGVGDFNADGTMDILWRNTTTGEIDTWMLQNGHYASGTAVGLVSSAWQTLGVGDFNKDGTSDILFRNTNTGEVDVWLLQDGHYQSGGALGTASNSWQFGGVGDYNGDGTSDLSWVNVTTGEVDTWFVKNGNYFGGSADGHVSGPWIVLA